MRDWIYTYKTSDGLRHEGEMNAPSKDAVYAALREKGIRAIKVTERIAPVVRSGFAGLRKRDWAIVAAALAAVALVFVFSPISGLRATAPASSASKNSKASTSPNALRRQLPGLDVPAVAAAIFTRPSERWLARFAQPGRMIGKPPTEAEAQIILDDLIDSFDAEIVIAPSDAPAVVELKRIVSGLKNEARVLIQGGREPSGIARYFETRQEMEAAYAEEIRRSQSSPSEKQAKLNAMELPIAN